MEKTKIFNGSKPALLLAAAFLAGFSTVLLEASQVDYYTSYSGTATFYGGSDASGTMGGACGYGDLYSTGYGTNTAALSMALFNDGASCGNCYKITCDSKINSWGAQWCRQGRSVIITGTNLCPPNYGKPSDNGGWCNPPRPHFDMAEPAWLQIGIYQAGIIPVLYQRVPCAKRGGVRFTMNGNSWWPLVLVWNVGGAGSVQRLLIKGSSTGWMEMQRNWGANWSLHYYLLRQSVSFTVFTGDGQKLAFSDAVPSSWQFGQTFTIDSVQFST